MQGAYVGKGTVTKEGELQLDAKLPLPPGRVLVRVEPLPAPDGPRPHLLDLAGQSGLARTREEIDAQLRSLRQEWGD